MTDIEQITKEILENVVEIFGEQKPVKTALERVREAFWTIMRECVGNDRTLRLFENDRAYHLSYSATLWSDINTTHEVRAIFKNFADQYGGEIEEMFITHKGLTATTDILDVKKYVFSVTLSIKFVK